MKPCLILLLFFTLGTTKASDVSCQTELLKLKMTATNILEEHDKPATMTVGEAQTRLKKISNKEKQSVAQETEESQDKRQDGLAEPIQKQSSKSGMFDILLPSKLRNPVK